MKGVPRERLARFILGAFLLSPGAALAGQGTAPPGAPPATPPAAGKTQTGQAKASQPAPAKTGSPQATPAATKPAETKPKTHQATGSVASASATRLVLVRQFGRNKVNWTFVLTTKTDVQGKPAKPMRVRIYYHDYHDEKAQHVADRVRIVDAAPAAAASANKGPAAPSSTTAPSATTRSQSKP